MATAAKRFTSPGLLTNPSASIGETKRRLIYALLDKFYCPSLRSVNEYRRIAPTSVIRQIDAEKPRFLIEPVI